MKAAIILLCLVNIIFFVQTSVMAEEVVTLKTRSGVIQKLVLVEVENPKAVLVLFPGGKGTIDPTPIAGMVRYGWGKDNFLVRTRHQFASKGFIVALVDAPSDRQSGMGMLGGFRTSRKHLKDMEEVIKELKRRFHLPVWLVGTSRGTESAAFIAINSEEKIDGLVLASPITVSDKKGSAVTDMEVEKIEVPVLLLVHRDDGCPKTPPSGVDKIAARLVNAFRVAVKILSGGDEPESTPCKGLSQHGFLGVEEKAVNLVADFVLEGN